MASQQAKPKILPLTSARFFAALYVVLFHTMPRFTSSGRWQEWFNRLIGLGYISVSFFFMLSGFILAVVYLRENKPIDHKKFFLARFARIYPLYFVAMLLDTPHFLHARLALQHAAPWRALVEFLATAGLVQAWFDIRTLNTPGWSLSTETFFYIVFPFLGFALWKLRDRLVLPVSVAIYGAGLLLVHVIDRDTSAQGYNPVPHLFMFLLGILLAKVFVWIGRSRLRSQRLEAAAPSLLAVCLVLLLAVPATAVANQTALLQHGLLAPLFAVAILAFASGNETITKVFASSWLVVLGEASYALYLIHYPILNWIVHPFWSKGAQVFVIYVLGTIGLSVLSYFYLEIPARRWILSKVHVRSKETKVTSSLSQ